MAYIKQDFQGGDVLYADQLNSMDDKIEENDATVSIIMQQINDLQRRVGMVEKAALTTTARTALINFLANVAYTHNAGKQYYNQLTDSLTIGLVSISAIFMNNVLIYDTDTLETLRQYLTVAATYEDGVTQNVSNYSLSGLLQPGTRTITVTYNSFTTTFDITVVHNNIFLTTQFDPLETIYTDTLLEDLKPYLVVTRHSDTEPAMVLDFLEYQLYGELTEGTSTITVKYQNLATTFDVNVVLQTRFITASFSQIADVYASQSLDSIKQYLTITYYENDQAQGIVIPSADYTLSGSLEIGVNIITAIYNKRRTTFSVVAKNPAHIEARFNPGAFVVFTDTALDQLKDYLVVLYYPDLTGTPTQITYERYTLQGTLVAGTSTITVIYYDVITTFDVIVYPVSQKTFIANFDFTESIIDKAGNIIPEFTAAEGFDAPERTSEGIIFNQPCQCIYFGEVDPIGKTFEFDVANMNFLGNTSYHVRTLMFTNNTQGTSPFIWRSGNGFGGYGYSAATGTGRAWSKYYWPGLSGKDAATINKISGKTVRLVFETQNSIALYFDNSFIGRMTDIYFNTPNNVDGTGAHSCKRISFGAMNPSNPLQTAGDQCFNMTLSGFRIYTNIAHDPNQHITVEFDQGDRYIYSNTPMSTIKNNLTVTYYASLDAEGILLTDSQYSISGSLQEGVSTLIVMYEGMTASFTVDVSSKDDMPYILNFDFTTSLEDKANNITPILAAAEEYSAPQRTSEGIIFNQPTQTVEFGDIDPIGKTFEFDVASFSFAGNPDYHCRFLMFSNTSTGSSPFLYRAKYGYNAYGYADSEGKAKKWSTQKWPGLQGTTTNVINSISGKTVKLVFESQNSVALYLNDTFIGRQTDVYYNSVSSYTDLKTAHYCKRICFGGLSSTGQLQTAGDQCYNLTLSGFRVYENMVGD